MKPTEFWRWRIKDDVPPHKLYNTRHWMTEKDALQRHPEAVRVPGSMEIRNLPETGEERMDVGAAASRRAPAAPAATMSKYEWLDGFKAVLAEQRPEMGLRLRVQVALNEWTGHGTTDPAAAAKRWLSERPKPPG